MCAWTCLLCQDNPWLNSMTMTQVFLEQGRSKKGSFIAQTVVCADCRNVTRAVSYELNVHFNTMRRLQCLRIQKYIHLASQPQTTCNYTSPGLPHLVSRLQGYIWVLVILNGALTWLQSSWPSLGRKPSSSMAFIQRLKRSGPTCTSHQLYVSHCMRQMVVTRYWLVFR